MNIINQKKERLFGLDLVRACAVFFVVLVHSFLNTGYNATDIEGMSMFLLLIVRNLAYISVLLFIILTGYCKKDVEVSKQHYKKIWKILVIYLVISIFTLFFRKFYLQDGVSLYNLIIGIFNFTTLSYGWYVEMYIGLFLLIPFLNILYKNLKSKKQKQLLIVTLFLISSIPQTVSTLVISNHSLDFLPNWWGSLYPLLLYFVGCYISEYKIRLSKAINIILIFSLLFLESFMMYFYCQGSSLNAMIHIDYNYFPAILLAILVFLLLYDLKINGNKIRSIIAFVSKASFGLYLFSYIYDQLIYSTLKIEAPIAQFSFLGIVLYTPIIFTVSLFSSAILNEIIDKITKILQKKIKKHKEKYGGVIK